MQNVRRIFIRYEMITKMTKFFFELYIYKMYASRFYVSSFFSHVSRFVWLTVSDFVWRKVYVGRAFFLLFVLYRVVF